MIEVLLMDSLLYQGKDKGKDLLYNSMVKLKDKDLITITKDIYLATKVKALTTKAKT
jgi:hypothetical protein